MLLKPGDRVSFLNEKRDGVVKKILNNKMVVVTIDDGFDIPVLEHDLVKVQSFKEPEKTVMPTPLVQKMEYEKTDEEEDDSNSRSRIELNISDDINLRPGLYLAFVPVSSNNVFTSFEIFLVNHFAHSLLFTYALKEEEDFICKDFDRVDEETAILLETINKTDIEKWKEIHFHFLFFKLGVALLKAPLGATAKIKPIRFYKDDNFIFQPVLQEKCLMISITEKEAPAAKEWDDTKWKNSKIEKPAGIKVVGHIKDYLKAEPVPEKHIIEPRIAEVDLHIEELTDDYQGKDNFELLTIQLKYFTKMMESALANKFRRIIFIHGVGNGKLKQEITDKLIRDYPGIKFCDASVMRYGKGATEVILTEL